MRALPRACAVATEFAVEHTDRAAWHGGRQDAVLVVDEAAVDDGQIAPLGAYPGAVVRGSAGAGERDAANCDVVAGRHEDALGLADPVAQGDARAGGNDSQLARTPHRAIGVAAGI